MKKIVLIVIFILVLFPITVKAQETDTNYSNDDPRIQSLYDYITGLKSENDILKDIDTKDYIQSFLKSGNGNISSGKIVNYIFTYGFKEVAASMKLMIELLIVAIMCSLISNLEKAFSNENLTNIAYFACFSLMVIILIKNFYLGINTASSTINKITNFMGVLTPALMVLLAGVGGFTEASLMDPIIIGAVNIFSKLFTAVIIPIILLSFVLQFVNSISRDYKLNKLSKLFSQIALWIQGIIMTVFIGIITIRGITSKTIDQVTVKTAKYAVDNFVPVVGKCLSDSISTVAGYSLLLKNALSSLGLIVILAIVILPIIKILVMAFIFKLTAAVIEPIGDERMVDCISHAGDSMVLIMSCLISISVMFFIMISIVAASGKALIGG